MRMLIVVAALAAAPTSSLAAEAWFDAVVDPRAPLDMPVERVPGRALLKLDGLDPRDLVGPRSEKAHKALLAIAERSGVALELVRPSILGWGLYDVRDPAALKERPSEAQTLALVERLAEDVGVAGATDDRWYRTLALPNDPAVDDMWHLDAIGAPAAWDLTTGTSSQRIGVVDTGTLRDHVELSAKAIAGYDFISSGNAAGDGNGRDADFSDEGDGADCGGGYHGDSWHGSHVAGTILASADNGSGIAGLNWGASLVTARTMGKCGGAISDIMEGAAWLAGAQIDGVPNIGADKVSVMNLSLGGDGGCSNYEQDVVSFVADQGVVFVAAAGNNGGSVGSPANCNTVVSVAAHGPGANKPLAPYSSFGSTVEVVAPGGFINGSPEDGVLSLAGPGSEYTWSQGTSMAAPHVTGAISLLQVFDATLTRGDLAELFADNGDDCSGCNGVKALRIDLLLQAIGATAQPPTDDPPVDDPPVDDPPPAEPIDDDTLEPNDAWAQRKPLPCGADRNLVMAEGNVDWFSVTAPADADVEVTVVAGVDLDLFLASGPNEADVLDASTSETGNEVVGLTSTGSELGIAVLPWMEAAGSYRLVVTCTGGSDTTPPADDPVTPPTNDPDAPPADDPAAPATPDDDEPAPIDEQPEGTMTRAEQLNGGLSGGCSQSTGSAAPFALLLVGVAMITLRPSRRRRR